MQQSSTLDVMDHAFGLCCRSRVKTADCAAPMKFIHAVSDSCAGYFFTTIAYKASKITMSFDVYGLFPVLCFLLFPKSLNASAFQITVFQSVVVFVFLEPIHKTIRYSCYVQVCFRAVKNSTCGLNQKINSQNETF